LESYCPKESKKRDVQGESKTFKREMHCSLRTNKGSCYVNDPEATLPQVSATWLVEQLDAQLDDRETLLAFDADGTLWSGDVSDDVFLAA
jgi:hypothetical protein